MDTEEIVIGGYEKGDPRYIMADSLVTLSPALMDLIEIYQTTYIYG